MKSVRYSLIYRFFASQIQFGYYKTGDYLPSIEEMHQIYHASPGTVRNAYLQLQKDGYISVSSGRKTSVVFGAPASQCSWNLREYYLSRRDAVLNLNGAWQILITPLQQEGCRRLSHQEMHQVKEMAAAVENGDFYFSYFCGRAMVLALKNRLLLDLFNEVTSFYQFPHTLLRRGDSRLNTGQFRTLSCQAVDACKRNDREALFQSYMQVQRFMDQVLRAYMVHAESEHPVRQSYPFEWKVYRERPQLCYSIAAGIIGRIYISREYLPESFLPSYGVMAENYSVSFSTIRRTVELLEKLGAVVTFQGVGTKVILPEPNPIRTQDAAVQRIFKMFLEVLEILHFSIDNIINKFNPESIYKSKTHMKQLQDLQGCSGFTAFYICTDLLFSSYDNPSLKNIWGKLYEILLLGLPLLEAQSADYADQLSSCSDKLVPSLETKDTGTFCQTLKELIILVTKAAKEMFRTV